MRNMRAANVGPDIDDLSREARWNVVPFECPNCLTQIKPEGVCFCEASKDDWLLAMDRRFYGMSYVTPEGCRVPPWRVGRA